MREQCLGLDLNGEKAGPLWVDEEMCTVQGRVQVRAPGRMEEGEPYWVVDSEEAGTYLGFHGSQLRPNPNLCLVRVSEVRFCGLLQNCHLQH